MKTDWMIDEPIDFEYHKYKMLGYFQKMAQELDDFKLYPHFQQISLHFANFSNLKGKDQYIKLVNELEEIDDEILLSDLEYKDVPEMSPHDYAEYRMIVDFGEEKFKEYFLVAKTIWQTLYETIWLSLLENDEELKRGRGYVFFDYDGRKYLYRYELKKFKRYIKNLIQYMVKNQLFRVLPDIDIINILLESVGLSSLDDTNFFTKETINELKTIEKFNEIKDKLDSYYLPCKSKVYLTVINDKKCITIIRQFIKVHNYTLISKERYINRKKLCVYRLIKLDDKPKLAPKSSKKDIVISFE